MKTIYIEKGYDDREDYLRSLADEYDMPHYDVMMMADLLGETEDFDGLVSLVQDFAEAEGGY